MARYRLRHDNAELELPPGEVIVGRGAECQLVLDDVLVSRRHARILVAPQGITVEDLGSRNGVLVNGSRERGMRALTVGDRLQFGTKEFVLVLKDEAEPHAARPDGSAKKFNPRQTMASVADDETTHTGSTSGLLLKVASKLLSQGKIEEATKLSANAFADLRAQLAGRAPVAPTHLSDCARHVLALVTASGRRDHLDVIFDVYRAAQVVLDGPLIDSIHATIRATKYPASQPLRSYVEQMRGAAATLSPAERFRVNRLEGLVAVASTFR